MDFLNALVALDQFRHHPRVAYGSQLALGALGVTLIYSILRFSNFAHGDTMAFGTMMTILVTWLLQSWGVSFGVLPTALLALPFGILATMALVLVTDRRSIVLPRPKGETGGLCHGLPGRDVHDERLGAVSSSAPATSGLPMASVSSSRRAPSSR